jgi:hypothetical protein
MSSDVHPQDEALAGVVDSLAQKFPDIPEDVVAEHVERARAPMVDAPLQEYVPVLVKHRAQVSLNAMHHDAQTTDPPDTEAHAAAD